MYGSVFNKTWRKPELCPPYFPGIHTFSEGSLLRRRELNKNLDKYALWTTMQHKHKLVFFEAADTIRHYRKAAIFRSFCLKHCSTSLSKSKNSESSFLHRSIGLWNMCAGCLESSFEYPLFCQGNTWCACNVSRVIHMTSMTWLLSWVEFQVRATMIRELLYNKIKTVLKST